MNKRNILFLNLTLIAIVALGQRPMESSLTPPVKVSNMSPYVWNSPHFNSFVPNGNSYEDKLFRDGLSRGKTTKDYFTLVNNENKAVDVEKLIQYCNLHNYLYKDKYTKKNIKKFGSGVETVAEFYFLPKDLYIFYVFEWTDRQNVPISALKEKGTAYFYVPDGKCFVLLNDALWSGDVINGNIDGYGSGILKKDDKTYYYFTGKFINGVPQGKMICRIVDLNCGCWGYTVEEARKIGGKGIDFYEVEIGNWNEGVATLKVPGNKNYGLVSLEGDILGITLQPTYPEFLSSYNNGKIVVVIDNKESYINKTGDFLDYTPNQKKIDADKKAEEERKKAEEERQRLLAEKKKEEERRLAEEREAAILRSIEPNKNPKLWSRGCHLAYRYPGGKEYIIATLEEWNENRTKVKVKIVASPGAGRTYKGDLLQKNNTMWISVHNEGWHLATDDEIQDALKGDNSIKRDPTCSWCNGRGTRICSRCDGKGKTSYRSWGSTYYKQCEECLGQGWIKCRSCDGLGKN